MVTLDRNNSKPASIVVRKGTITDRIMPTANVYFGEYLIGVGVLGWEELPLISPASGSFPEDLEEKARLHVGKIIQVLLPLKIEDVVNDYVFAFRVNDVKVEK